MRVIPIALEAQYAAASSTMTGCLYVKRKDGLEIGVTELDRSLLIDGMLYRPNLSLSDIVSTAGTGVDNLELTVFPDDDEFLARDLAAGRWDNATFRIFRVNYRSLADGQDTLKSGTTGEVQINDGSFVLEFRGLTQALQQTVGIVTSKTCRANFADFPKQNGSNRCGLDPAPWTVTGAITDLASAQTLSDSGRAEPDEWFQEGILTMTSGEAEGYAQKVKVYAGSSDGGTFTLSLPLPFRPEVGDTYSVIAGCQKRHDRSLANPGGVSDCGDKFDNLPNFQGEPHLPGVDAITANPSTV